MKGKATARMYNLLSYLLRFTNAEDKIWFNNALERVVKDNIDPDLAATMSESEPYFVDFLQEAPEPTGEETDDADLEAPKIYEAVGLFLG